MKFDKPLKFLNFPERKNQICCRNNML